MPNLGSNQDIQMSVGEWISCGISTMEYYLALKRNELSRHEKIPRKTKYIITREANLRGYIMYDSNCRTCGKGKKL